MAESEFERNIVEHKQIFINQEPTGSKESSNIDVIMKNDSANQNFQEKLMSEENVKEVKLENVPCKQEPIRSSVPPQVPHELLKFEKEKNKDICKEEPLNLPIMLQASQQSVKVNEEKSLAPCKREPLSPLMSPQASPKLVKLEEESGDACKREPLSPPIPPLSQELEKESGISDYNAEGEVSPKDEIDPKFLLKLQASKFPLVLLKKLNNLHCGIGYDAKLYDCTRTPVENKDSGKAMEKVMEKAFSQFITAVSKDEFRCSECGYIGKNKPHAVRHSLIHSDIKLYKCIDCHYESSRKDKYKNHLEKKHNASIFECKICEFATSQKYLLDKHSTTHQSQKINWRKKRKKRGRPFSTPDQKLLRTVRKKRKNLKVDLSEERFSEITRVVDGIYVCAICNYKTKAKDRAQRHSLIHTDMYYFCSECDSEFIGKDVYDAHIKDHHENKTEYECKDCNFICDQKKEYDDHLANHVKESSMVPTDSQEKLYSCSECNYKTRYQNHLVRHNRVHTAHKNPSSKRKLSKNSDSSKMTLDKYLDDFSDSVIEVAGHLYKCTLCPYVSTNKHHTRRHSLIHSETKLYKCTDCKFASNRKDKCKEHMRKIHPDKWKGGSTVFIRKSSTDSISECSSYDTEGSNGVPGSKKLYQCYECSFQTIFRSHLSKHQLRHIKRKDAPGFDSLEEDFGSVIIKEEINFDDMEDLENESNINEIIDLEENKMPLLLSNNIKADINIEDIKIEPTDFMIGHIKTEPSEFLVVEDGLVDTFLGEKETEVTRIPPAVETQVPPNEDKLLQCLDCNFTTYDEKCLRTHLCCKNLDEFSLNNENKKLFTCTECTYTTYRLKQLAAHIVAHSSLKSFKCTECDFQTIYRNNLKTHLLTHTDIKLFNCNECSYQTNYKSHLKKHQTVHKKKKLTSTENQTGELSNIILMNGFTDCVIPSVEIIRSNPPINQTNGEPQTTMNAVDRVLKCTKCSFICNHETELKDHLLTHFTSSVSVVTEERNSAGNRVVHNIEEQRLINESQEPHKLGAQISEPQRIGTITQESQKFETVSQEPQRLETVNQGPHALETISHELHRLVTVSQEPHKLVTVSQEPHRLVTVSQEPHRLVTVSQEPHKLVTVSQEPHKLVTVSQEPHRLVTVSQEPHSLVTVSQEPQRLETAVQEPQKSYADDCIYSCNQCDFKANKKTALRKHAIVHSTILYQCPECNFKTKYRSNLKPHLQTHMVEKLFKCSVCSYETNYKKNMSKHLQSHENAVTTEQNQICETQSVTLVSNNEFITTQLQVNTVDSALNNSQECSVPSSDIVLWPL